ncbi:MAG: permease-like cell division protein FtsX [Bacteroidota bacterium]
MALSYSIREGLAGFGRAKFATVTSVSALVVALVLIGLFGLLLWQGQQVARALQQQVGEFQVFLDLGADTRTQQTINNRLLGHPGVEAASFISQEQAYRSFVQDFGEGAEDVVGDNFLPASFRVQVTPDYATADSIDAIAATVEPMRGVDEVAYDAGIIERVRENLQVVQTVALALAVLVVLTALFLVGNTIRLTIYARRMLIRTMKLVGATNSFIQRPFLVEGIAQGLIAAVVACTVIWATYGALLGQIPQLAGRGWPLGSPFATFGAVFVLGALFGWLASWVAVRRFVQRITLS